MQCKNVPHAHGLFVHATARLHPVCVRRWLAKKKTGQNRPKQYTEEMRYLRRFDQLMQPEFKHAGPPLPTKLTAVYRTRAAADMAMHTARAGTCT
jgi:hypothetical protein